MCEDEKKLEAYRSLAALYIQVDESVMTRHKFYLTIIVTILTAIGLIIYQSETCCNNRTYILINIATILGLFISLAWFFISLRGLFIDEVLSDELDDVEKILFPDEDSKFRAFKIYNEALTNKSDTYIPPWYKKIRMEYISMFVTGSCFAMFLLFFLGFNFCGLGNYLWPNTATEPTNQICGIRNDPTLKKEIVKVSNSPINNITINLPHDKHTDTDSSNLTDDVNENSLVKQ
jgi:hypothetical protein